MISYGNAKLLVMDFHFTKIICIQKTVKFTNHEVLIKELKEPLWFAGITCTKYSKYKRMVRYNIKIFFEYQH